VGGAVGGDHVEASPVVARHVLQRSSAGEVFPDGIRENASLRTRNKSEHCRQQCHKQKLEMKAEQLVSGYQQRVENQNRLLIM